MTTTAFNPTQGLIQGERVKKNSLQASTQSFYGKRFKCLRVTHDMVCSFVKAIAYKICALSCRIVFQKDVAHHYNDLAIYNFHRMGNRLVTYCIYGNKLVNFAINCTGTPRLPKQKGMNAVDQLKKIYGKPFEKMLQQVSSVKFPIVEDQLSQYPINQGICFGAILDFLSVYFSQQAGSPLQKIENVSQQFSEKGTPVAQMLQILYCAQSLEPSTQKIEDFQQSAIKELDAKTDELHKCIRANREKINKEIEQAKSKSERDAITSKAKLMAEEEEKKLDQLQKDSFRSIALFLSELFSERVQSLGNAVGLKIETNSLFHAKDSQMMTSIVNFQEGISKLPLGGYISAFRTFDKDHGDHAIAFIKASENECYLFDPNWGTIKFDSSNEMASELWTLAKLYHNNPCALQVFNCSKA